MNLDQARKLINQYRILVNNGNIDLLGTSFQNADVVTFEGAHFENFDLDHLLVHLGYDDKSLFAIITNDDKYPTEWNNNTTFYVSKFTKKSQSNAPDYINGYENPADTKHSNYISQDIAAKRMTKWSCRKKEWIQNMISTNSVVRYFELPKAGFINDAVNHLNLGIDESNNIDLMLGNESGLYDFAKPVPPFPKKTDWGF